MDPLDTQPLKALARGVRRHCRQSEWRRNVLLRSTRIALTLKAIERVLGPRLASRRKTAARQWEVFAQDENGTVCLVAVVGGGATRTLDELRAPIPIEIVAPALIDIEALRAATGAPENDKEK